MWWATTSCSSRAMVVRSSSRVRRSRSTAVTVRCTVTSRSASRRIWITATTSSAKADSVARGAVIDGSPPSSSTPNSRVSSHIQAAVRGLVRAATTTRTTTWAPKALGPHSPSLPRTPQKTAASIEAQNAATGLTRVIATAIAGTRPISRRNSHSAKPAIITRNAANSTRACGVQTTARRIPSGSRRTSRPSGFSGGRGR
ncbi:hypothetical protein M2436_003904 [Streptomyces sp. HB372]|nr:hypothetical protein [Streptomyces sp. HB372]